jgi:FkbM family methyltransferase
MRPIKRIVGAVRRRLFSTPPAPSTPEDVVDQMRARVTADPSDRNAWRWLGESLVAVGRFDEAEPALQRMLALGADRDAWMALGTVESHRGRLEEAAAWFARAVDHDPDDAAAWTALGTMQSQRHRVGEALESFLRAVECRPTDAAAWGALSSLLPTTGKGLSIPQLIRDAAGLPDPAATRAADARTQAYRERARLVLIDLIDPLLPADERFVVLDGGAREALADPRLTVLPRSRLTVHGFEPDAPECARLNHRAREAGLDLHYHAIGLWSHDGVLPFEDNNIGSGSSFLPQNRTVTDRWRFESPHAATSAHDNFYPTKIVELPVTSVTNWASRAGVGRLDFVKLNVQGAELEILRGFGPLLDRVDGMLVEVSFVESYKNRPMFADLDMWLRDHGFAFFDLIAHHYVGRTASPLIARHCRELKPHWGELTSFWGQLIEGHALYFRDPIAAPPADLPLAALATRILKLACLAEMFGQIEYAFELIAWLRDQAQARGDAALADRMAALGAEGNARYRRFVCAAPRADAPASR